MAKKLGLDFGTTNSILSQMDGKELTSFRMGGAGQSNYIPSYISYDLEEPDSITIGHAAKSNLNDPDEFETFGRFKLLLGEQDKSQLERFGYGGVKSPQTVSQDFLKVLFDEYREQQQSDVESVVITVPEVWFADQNQLARERLHSICKNLDIPLHSFISEPVAASALFCYEFKKKQGTPFNGHVLVVDCGGGTIDISLVHAANSTIRVIDRAGSGRVGEELGQAGVAFDEAVVKIAYERQFEEPLSRHDPRFSELMKAFEEDKIQNANFYAQILNNYTRDNAKDRATKFSVFGFDKRFQVRASDLSKAYKTFDARLETSLKEIQKSMLLHGIDTNSAQSFRVVMVGGFSNFALVPHTVARTLGLDINDPRLKNELSLHNRALGISMGAALIANDRIEVVPTCPIYLGISTWDMALQQIDLLNIGGWRDIFILEQGVTLRDYNSPVYFNGTFNNQTHRNVDVIFCQKYQQDGPVFRKQCGEARKLLPNFDNPNAVWQIGFSSDANMIFYLHAKDQTGQEIKTRLGEVLINTITLNE